MPLPTDLTSLVGGSYPIADLQNDILYAMQYGNFLSSVSGTNTITANADEAPAAYAAGQLYWFVPAGANTGATTLNVSSLGAKDVYRRGAACTGGELLANVPAAVYYDGTQFNLMNPALPAMLNSQSAAYTLVLGDAFSIILHPSADNNARTFTIPANASVAYPVGTPVTFINAINTLTIAITTDTMTMAGTGSTGSRTLAANGIATVVKYDSTHWLINGTGLS